MRLPYQQPVKISGSGLLWVATSSRIHVAWNTINPKSGEPPLNPAIKMVGIIAMPLREESDVLLRIAETLPPPSSP
jgi:hypothetical protein